ncbi:MAG: Smr/MutS family protein [bacterium]|nr:Smr/MutS family protein [bacterium]
MKKTRRNKQWKATPSSERESLPDINLHDLHPDIALADMEAFLQRAKKDGISKVLIIHGKGSHGDGTGTLRRRVRARLNHLEFAFHPADPWQGGDGATVVLLN